MFSQILIQGILINGSIYALLALGFALIFGAARVVNLYHGTFYMLGAYFTYSFYSLSIPLGIAAILSLICVGALGLVVFKIIEPIRKQGVAVLIVTIGLAFFTQELIHIFYGTGTKNIPSFLNMKDTMGLPMTSITISGVVLPVDRLFAFGVAVVLIFLLWIFVDKTKAGKGVMAVAQDEEAAMTVGINPRVVNIIAIAFSAMLAGAAGIVRAPFLPVNSHMWLDPLIKAFAIVILGGLGSVWGSVIAAFILAFAEAMASNLISPSLGSVVFLLVVLIMLVVKPKGIMGKTLRF
ncbi:MAG TPA: branched-chain amino acid ABC transporter permease [Spirochaetia bacterium]|nr:MAG: hypothetical protein A2Y41_11810 [Spirochaetes bacterium GWB1_36_13]HCL56736.1 branched-chain amino acid ABC transporter permease [Spirochaetia bacterium]